MSIRRLIHPGVEKELEAIIGILKLKKGMTQNTGWSEKVKKTPFQIRVLQELFKITEFPSTTTRRDLSLLLSIPQRSIQVWFQNTRQAKKKYRDILIDKGVYTSSDDETDIEDVSLCQLLEILNDVKTSMVA